MARLLRFLLRRYIRRGSLTFVTASGTRFTCGDGTGDPVTVRFLTSSAQRRLLLDPELALGEIIMDGSMVVERGSVADLLAVCLSQPDLAPRWAKLQWWLRRLLRPIQQFNPRKRSRHTVCVGFPSTMRVTLCSRAHESTSSAMTGPLSRTTSPPSDSASVRCDSSRC